MRYTRRGWKADAKHILQHAVMQKDGHDLDDQGYCQDCLAMIVGLAEDAYRRGMLRAAEIADQQGQRYSLGYAEVARFIAEYIRSEASEVEKTGDKREDEP